MKSSVKWRKGGPRSAEKIAATLAGLSLAQLRGQLLTMRTKFRMDFTKEFLDSLSKDELRHILLAAHLNAR